MDFGAVISTEKRYEQNNITPNHPAFDVKEENFHIFYEENFSFPKSLEWLYKNFNCERLTVQSGGTVNAIFLREKLFDFFDIVVASVLVDRKNSV